MWSFALRQRASIGSHVSLSQQVLSFLCFLFYLRCKTDVVAVQQVG